MRNFACLQRVVRIVVSSWFLTAVAGYADQVEMKNGDRYVGQVASLSTDTLILTNDILGTVKLPRDKVLQVTLGTQAAVTPTRTVTNLIITSAPTGLPAKAATLSRTQLAPTTPTNVMLQVQEELLGNASPEAKAKFQELASGYLSGSISENQIRSEAKAAADQLRKFKAELGADAGEELDGYLTILEGFLNEQSTSATSSQTNRPAQILQSRR